MKLLSKGRPFKGCAILLRWPVGNVRAGIIQPQRTREKHLINWHSRNIAGFAGHIRLTGRQSSLGLLGQGHSIEHSDHNET